MIFALIYGGMVNNTIICSSQELANILWPDMTCIDITNVDPRPGIGWTYNDGVFTPPPPAPTE